MRGLVFHTTQQTRNGNGLISDKKIKELYKYAREANTSYLEKFVEEELRLGELSSNRLKIGDKPLITKDDKIFITLILEDIISQYKKDERDSGRYSSAHSIDTAKESIDAYLDEYLPKIKGLPNTLFTTEIIGTNLCHDLKEDKSVTREEFVQSLRTRVSDSRIKNKYKYKYSVLPLIWKNTEGLTRGRNYYNVWQSLVSEWNKEQRVCKVSDRTSNVRELVRVKPPLESFITNIKEPLKRVKILKYPSRRVLNFLSTLSHRGTESLMDLMHKFEKSKRLYPNPKTLYEIFKSFIIIDATNQHMNNHMKDDFLIILKQRLIRASVEQLKRVTEHLLKYHCEGLKKGYAISEMKERLLEYPLLIIDEHYLKKLGKRINIFKNKDLISPDTVQKALTYFERDYKKRKTGSKFKVGDLIYLHKVFQEYINTGRIDRLTYARKNGREHPFDNLIYPWLNKIAEGDKEVMEDLRKQYEVEYKLAKVLTYKLWQYRDNHTVTFGWGRKKGMQEAANNKKSYYPSTNRATA